MPRRLQLTLIDYVVIAINPALIMVLIGSLIYFILEMCYQGQYPGKLHFCLSMFILGAVLVSRISMEDGWDRAVPFGLALAVVICLAMHRFVSYQGTNLAEIGWLINYGLIALIWWCAHKLTWDCTLIDETQDASGEGLLQTAGLDSAEKESSTTKVDEKIAKNQATAKRDRKITAADVSTDFVLPPEKDADKRKSWWQRFLERRRRPHAPGLWVVYFSIAALPMFGLGQTLIPVENSGSRRYAFELLCLYVACGLGLLLTTSFLGLRRYLRQRRLEMPAAMAGTWLTTGVVLIVAILIFTALVPRPNAEYTISQLPWQATSAEHDSSKFATGKEGTKDDQANGGSGTRKSSEEDQNLKSGGSQKVEHPETGGDQKSSEQKSNPSSKPSENPQNSPSQDGKSSGDKSNSDDKGKSSDPSNENKSNSSNQNQSNPSESKPSLEQQASQSAPQQNNSPSESPSQSPDMTSNLMDSLSAILKWVFYGVVILAALWWLWRNPQAILAWLRSLLAGWRNFWGNLFGRRRSDSSAAAISAASRKSFLDYSNPFQSGLAGRATPQELVKYSFEAFEAWARDNGCPRETDQTPIEFVRQVGMKADHLAKPGRALAELYCIAAYSPRSLPVSSVEQLQKFWQALQTEWAMA